MVVADEEFERTEVGLEDPLLRAGPRRPVFGIDAEVWPRVVAGIARHHNALNT
ncbi:MAG: hypothetical protein ACTHW3_10535 [Leucobacter sp.]